MNEVVSNNYDSNHQAIDIVSSDHSQSDIIALESGIVETVVKNIQYTNHNTKGLATYGNYIKIKQTDGKEALYAHMKYGSINVNVGDFVEKGAIIGTMGATGNAYGNHLHLEIKNENGIKENPLITLNKEIEEKTKNEEIKENKTEEKNKEIEEKTKNKLNEETVSQNEENKTEEKNEEIKENKTEEKNESNVNTNEQIEILSAEYLNNSRYKYGSIVDALKEINIDSSYSYRKKLAKANNITNYHGSYNQNVKLLKLLKEGNLKKA